MKKIYIFHISSEIENGDEKDQKLGMIIFSGVGILVLVIGGIQINNMKFIKSASTTETLITKIDSHYESASDDSPTYYVYITYKVNDVIHDELLDLYYTEMHEGQK